MLPLFIRTLTLMALGALGSSAVYWARGDASEPANPAACEAPAEATAPAMIAPAQAWSQCQDARTLFLDVRAADVFRAGHIAGAVHLPCQAGDRLPAIASRLREVDLVVVYGEGTDDAMRVATSLPDATDVRVLEGGYGAWEAAALACVSGPCNCEEHGA